MSPPHHIIPLQKRGVRGMNAAPKRIQLSRKKGWRKPEGAVVVDRRTRWGNPFWHVQRFHGVDNAIALYRDMVQGGWDPSLCNELGWPDSYVNQVYEDRRDWLDRLGYRHPLDAVRRELRGKDLACWCPLDEPCHADVLLELANAAEGTR